MTIKRWHRTYPAQFLWVSGHNASLGVGVLPDWSFKQWWGRTMNQKNLHTKSIVSVSNKPIKYSQSMHAIQFQRELLQHSPRVTEFNPDNFLNAGWDLLRRPVLLGNKEQGVKQAYKMWSVRVIDKIMSTTYVHISNLNDLWQRAWKFANYH